MLVEYVELHNRCCSQLIESRRKKSIQQMRLEQTLLPLKARTSPSHDRASERTRKTFGL